MSILFEEYKKIRTNYNKNLSQDDISCELDFRHFIEYPHLYLDYRSSYKAKSEQNEWLRLVEFYLCNEIAFSIRVTRLHWFSANVVYIKNRKDNNSYILTGKVYRNKFWAFIFGLFSKDKMNLPFKTYREFNIFMDYLDLYKRSLEEN